jgi:hypothetical protein
MMSNEVKISPLGIITFPHIINARIELIMIDHSAN